MLKIMLKFYFEIHIFSFSNPSIGINCFNKVNVKNTPKNFTIVKKNPTNFQSQDSHSD